MKQLARILRSRRWRSLIVLSLASLAFGFVALDTARACWNYVVVECMDRPSLQWPWYAPPGQQIRAWRVCSVVNGTTYCTPNIPASVSRWHIHNGNFFDILMCPDDNQSLWCYGWPIGNDPEYDHYPANYNTYVTYGRVDLSSATAARVLWSMWSATEVLHDSVYWGASKTATLVDSGMKIGGSTWQDTDDWQRFSMNLDSLHDFLTGAPFSFLGEDTVYVFWRFRSDGNGVRNTGTFIDNITISWDDGMQDLNTTQLELVRPDSDLVFGDPQIGQSIAAHFQYSVCDGSIEDYDPYHVVLTVNDVLMMDTVVSGTHAAETHEMYSPYWQVNDPGDFHVRVMVDSLNEIVENNENNNGLTIPYHVVPLNPPPQFTWVAPGADTLRGDSTVTLRWIVTDPDEQATVAIYYDNEPQGCMGTIVPGGNNRPEMDGPDSLVWTVRYLPDQRILHMFAHVWDSSNDTCIYAAYPVEVIHPSAVGERPAAGVPETYYVEQNYPNPFNPVTEIRYGVAIPGQVSVKVYSLLGREVATLVNERLDAGSYTVIFDGSRLPSGLYMYVLSAPEGKLGRKMMLLK
jgi:hypothetical protein